MKYSPDKDPDWGKLPSAILYQYSPTFFTWQGNSINLSYVMHAFREYGGLLIVMEDKTRVRFTDPDIIERFMKMMEA